MNYLTIPLRDSSLAHLRKSAAMWLFGGATGVLFFTEISFAESEADERPVLPTMIEDYEQYEFPDLKEGTTASGNFISFRKKNDESESDLTSFGSEISLGDDGDDLPSMVFWWRDGTKSDNQDTEKPKASISMQSILVMSEVKATDRLAKAYQEKWERSFDGGAYTRPFYVQFDGNYTIGWYQNERVAMPFIDLDGEVGDATIADPRKIVLARGTCGKFLWELCLVSNEKKISEQADKIIYSFLKKTFPKSMKQAKRMTWQKLELHPRKKSIKNFHTKRNETLHDGSSFHYVGGRRA